LPYQSSYYAEDLTKLSNLRELDVSIKPQIKVGTMGPWLDMRNLSLTYDNDADTIRDDADENILS
jgi:hypothetical protein